MTCLDTSLLVSGSSCNVVRLVSGTGRRVVSQLLPSGNINYSLSLFLTYPSGAPVGDSAGCRLCCSIQAVWRLSFSPFLHITCPCLTIPPLNLQKHNCRWYSGKNSWTNGDLNPGPFTDTATTMRSENHTPRPFAPVEFVTISTDEGRKVKYQPHNFSAGIAGLCGDDDSVILPRITSVGA